MKGKRDIESQLPQIRSKKYQLNLLRNIERRMPKTVRKRTMNWPLVQDYLLGFTTRGGSTSSAIHCVWLGVNPDGYTFFN